MYRTLFCCFFLINASICAAQDSMQLTYRAGKSPRIMILAHGMGANFKIYESLDVDQSLISFNFPDHDMFERGIPFEQTTFGTFEELIPLLMVMKKYIIEKGNQEIDLYGFSAGGGAIINVLAALNTHRVDERLKQLGISQDDKTKMLQTVQKGVIILDVPLKSIQELVDMSGNQDLVLLQRRYAKNHMEPIDSMQDLKGLSLNIIVHFQNPDEALSNRDDYRYFERLKSVNSRGTTTLIVGSDGGHYAWHKSLWDFYKDRF